MFNCTCYNADLETFRVMFPGLNSVSDDLVQDSINKANCTLSSKYWGDTICQATLYLAAHNIAYLQNAAAASEVDSNGFVVTNKTAGDISSASAAGLSVSFEAKASASYSSPYNDFYSSTPYGQAFLALAQSRMPRMLIGSCGIY